MPRNLPKKSNPLPTKKSDAQTSKALASQTAQRSSSQTTRRTGSQAVSQSVLQTSKSSSFHAAQSLFQHYQLQDKGGYITQEFQDFGYRLTMTLNDPSHKSLYMNLAKRESRILLEQALSFVEDAASARSKAKLFMWKLKQLKMEQKLKDKSKKK